MPDLLLELRSEEIPARMQRKAADDLKARVTNALVDAGLTYEAATPYFTPRRLTLDIRGLTARSKDQSEEIKGPSTKAPEQAIAGFMRKAGLTDIAQAQVQSDPKKGDFYVAIVSKPGQAAEEIIASVMPGIIRDFPWPKSMRWGAASAQPGSLRWVRPLQSIVCTFGPETEEPVVIDFEVGGIRSSNVTAGHRFHAPESFTVRRFDDYVEKLEKAFVVLDAERRKNLIRTEAKNIAFASGLELIEDEGLLEEVAGLVEWPVVLMGEFEPEFLEIPGDVIRLTIKTNQKCFVTRKADGELANRFILVANIEASDDGKEIAYGNGKVVRARLSDALYFWKTDQASLPDVGLLEASAKKFGLDLAKPLDQRMARLDHLNVTFHAKLGTQGERVARIAALAEELAPVVGADRASARRAAVLAKADLQTEIVGEFPELQGAMGRIYAGLQGESADVAEALEDHYKPQGPSDGVPSGPVAIAVALADKLDTLTGFWAIDEKPTGSKDPYALRRAALGVIRIVLENEVNLSLVSIFSVHHDRILRSPRNWRKLIARDSKGLFVYPNYWFEFGTTHDLIENGDVVEIEFDAEAEFWPINEHNEWFFWDNNIHPDDLPAKLLRHKNEQPGRDEIEQQGWTMGHRLRLPTDLLSFFHDRLKVWLKDTGAQHDLIDAVLTPTSDDLLSIVRRVEALGAFLATDDGTNLLAGTKRAANILAAEEKKGTAIASAVDPALFETDAERNLFNAVNQSVAKSAQALEKEDFSSAMAALAALREPVDSFFEDVLVNAEDEKVRANRLALLTLIRQATGAVADFSRIAG